MGVRRHPVQCVEGTLGVGLMGVRCLATVVVSSVILCGTCVLRADQPAAGPGQTEAKPVPRGVAAVRADAAAMEPLVTSGLARAFLRAAERLPEVQVREIYRHKKTRAWFSADQAAALSEADRAELEKRDVDEQFYYTTKYGSPIAYARAMDVLGSLGFGAEGENPLAGKRVLDFGYGGIGHLRLLGLLGADVVGVDVDPMLPVLYAAPTDQGAIGAAGGSLKLVHGRWPAEAGAAEAVGGGFDVVVSKNTLKNGYVHPAREVDKRMLVDLGVPDEEYVKAVHAALKPGGWLVIYNLCPAEAPADKPYIPWADGRCPFPREMLEKAGFEVVAFDVVDDGPAREMGRTLGWERQGMKLEQDLFCWYTVARKK